MVVGVIAEGHSDRAVIVNIIAGITGLDDSDFIALMPQYKKDATDEAEAEGEIHGGWNAVRDECQKRVFINDFCELYDDYALVIHFDTMEASQYPISVPIEKDDKYCTIVRKLLIDKITEWIGEDLKEKIVHAIAIEETEAWILAVRKEKRTWKSADPKKKLEYKLGLELGKLKPDYESYLKHSEGMRVNYKEMGALKILVENQSLSDFCEEVIEKIVPQL